MSSIILKKSSVVGKVPLPFDLQYGEIALNYADGVIYYKKADNTIGTISGGSGSSASSRRIYETSLSLGQTVINIPSGYTVGLIDIIFNGAQLSSADYTATNGSSVILTTEAVAGDFARVVMYDPAGVTVTSTVAVNGFETSFLLMGA